MMFTHAEVAADGLVISLRDGVDGVDPESVVQLAEAVAHWPTPPHSDAVLAVEDGALVWRDVRTLAEAQAEARARVNTSWADADASHFEFGGKVIACGPQSRGHIESVNGVVLLTGAFPAGWPGQWKAVDNTYVPIADLPTWGAFYGAMVAQGMANFGKAQSLKGQIEAAADIAAADAVVW